MRNGFFAEGRMNKARATVRAQWAALSTGENTTSAPAQEEEEAQGFQTAEDAEMAM
jgi:hypothetical protein